MSFLTSIKNFFFKVEEPVFETDWDLDRKTRMEKEAIMRLDNSLFSTIKNDCKEAESTIQGWSNSWREEVLRAFTKERFGWPCLDLPYEDGPDLVDFEVEFRKKVQREDELRQIEKFGAIFDDDASCRYQEF